MEVEQKNEGTALVVMVKGRLDTSTAPTLETFLAQHVPSGGDVIFDLSYLDYVSSSGLRILLQMQKKQDAAHGTFVIRHVNETVKDILDVTGFSSVLTIQ